MELAKVFLHKIPVCGVPFTNVCAFPYPGRQKTLKPQTPVYRILMLSHGRALNT